MLAGAVCFDKSWSARERAKLVAASSSHFGQIRPRVFFDGDKICLYSLERPHDRFQIGRLAPETGSQWLLADVGYAPEFPLAELASTLLHGQLPSIQGRWISVFVDESTNTIRITNDDLGLAWLYIGRLPGGYVFSSHFAAVVRSIPRPSLNEHTLLTELAVGRAYNDETIAREITLAPAGSSVLLGPNEIKVVQRRRYRYGDEFSGLSQREKFEKLDGIYERITKRYVATFGPAVALSLSGGYDSRTALASMNRHGIRPALFTFGRPHGREVQAARKVAQASGSSTTIFEIPGTDWQDWLGRVETLGTSGMLQFSGWSQRWLELIRTKATSAVIGYLGDTITGKKLVKCEPHASEVGWVEGWARWELAQRGAITSPLVRNEKKSLMRELIYDNTKKEFSGVDCAYPFQNVLHGDLYGRQRRRAASQPNVLSRFVSPILFFYDRELVTFWCNLPYEDLLGQGLYYEYGCSRFPVLFPRRTAQSDGTRWRELAKRFAGKLVRRGQGNRSPGVIDHRTILGRHKQDVTNLVESTRTIMDEYIDVDALVRFVRANDQSQISPREAVQSINLMMLVNTML